MVPGFIKMEAEGVVRWFAASDAKAAQAWALKAMSPKKTKRSSSPSSSETDD